MAIDEWVEDGKYYVESIMWTVMDTGSKTQ